MKIKNDCVSKDTRSTVRAERSQCGNATIVQFQHDILEMAQLEAVGKNPVVAGGLGGGVGKQVVEEWKKFLGQSCNLLMVNTYHHTPVETQRKLKASSPNINSELY